MSYSVYIKKDYKPVVRWVSDSPWYRRSRTWLFALIGLTPVFLMHTIIASTDPSPESPLSGEIEKKITSQTSSAPAQAAAVTAEVENREQVTPSKAPPAPANVDERKALQQWKNIKVAKGDNLSLIFDRIGIAPAVLHQVLASGVQASSLKRLMPQQELRLLMSDDNLVALNYDLDLTRTLHIEKDNEGFTSRIDTTPLTTVVKNATAVIDSSLFLAGQDAGLTDNLIMQLVAIYGWDIDFVLDIRAGDQFKVIYQEQYKNGKKVSDGPILAAEFINQGNTFYAVRYVNNHGDADYFSETGASMRKAFLRTPLKFTRISSGFNLRRKHPILNTIRAHKGVDYAAPTGTPVKATGNGTVVYLGRKGGYGRVIVLKHGGTYSTLYGHLSAYARNLSTGNKVKQGQIIGYVGMSGLATGPHLHYEFRVNGVHRNPLTVKLPKADSIPDTEMADFKAKTGSLLAQLDNQFNDQKKMVLALGEQDTTDPSSPIPENY